MKTILFLALLGFALAESNGYDGYKVFRTEALSENKASSLQKLMLNAIQFDFWKEPNVGKQADIMASPKDMDRLMNILASLGIQNSVFVEDVGELIRQSEVPTSRKSSKGDARYALNWEEYQSLDNIYEFIEEIAALDSSYETKNIGQTFDGRDIMALELNKAGSGRPTIFVEAGIHAREWIANSVGTYLINQLTENSANSRYVDQLNFAFVPMANPDGYEWSRSSQSERLWRKNRSPFSGGIGCSDKHGVDLNRNFGFHYGESGTSDNPCSDTWHGDGAFSELESQALRDYWNGIESERGAPELSLCLHSYSQLFLIPYGYETGAPAPNYPAMDSLANDANDALFGVHGTRFIVENSAGLYPAAGASDDWYKSGGSDYTYTLELRDTGNFGFVLPANQIIPSGEEVWAAFEVILQRILEENP